MPSATLATPVNVVTSINAQQKAFDGSSAAEGSDREPSASPDRGDREEVAFATRETRELGDHAIAVVTKFTTAVAKRSCGQADPVDERRCPGRGAAASVGASSSLVLAVCRRDSRARLVLSVGGLFVGGVSVNCVEARIAD